MRLTVCPLSLAVFVGSAWFVTAQQRRRLQAKRNNRNDNAVSFQVVFVLGGPGSGKGTQCQLLAERLLDKTTGKKQWAHLSAGDLLRAERQKGGALGDLINTCIASGQLVPSNVTCKLLENAMQDTYATTGTTKFLIDGFPRSQDNADAWNTTMSQHCMEFLLFFECPEEVLVGRLLERAQTSGRNDDNIQVIRQRFETFQTKEAPIVEFYEAQGKVNRIASDKPVEDVYAIVSAFFQDL